MALHNLRDEFQTLYHILVHRTTLQGDTYIGTGAIAQRLGVNVESAACYNIIINKALHTLMNSSTRHTAVGCNILKRNACIL